MAPLEQPIPSALGRRFRLLLGLNRLLVRWNVLPRAERIGSIPIARRYAMKPAGWAVPRATPDVTATDRVISGRHGDVPVRVYVPANGTAAPTAVLYVHGGGFTVGGLDSLDWFCRTLSARGGHAVVSVQYRLAPDFPYPVPLDDVEDALTWTADHLDELGASRLAVAGDSAGGKLAAAACRRARDGGPHVTQQVLIYPALDATHGSASMSATATGLSRSDIESAFRDYRGDHPATAPEISPLLAPDLEGLPPALVVTSDHDILRDEGRLYAEALTRAGVAARLIEVAETDHAFLSLATLFGDATRSTTDAVLAALSTHDEPTEETR